MRHAPTVVVVGAFLFTSPLLASPSAENVRNETAELYRQATSAFGLGDYAEAAVRYERAFALTPNHALLFNAALSHERAGNVERSRTLFANYLRLYAKGEKAEDARRHLESKPAKAEDKSDAKSGADTEARPTDATFSEAPSTTAKTATDSASPPLPPGVVASPPLPPGVVLESAGKPPLAPAPPPSPPLWKKTWVWGAAAVVVAGIVTTVILVSLPKSETTPLWGRI